MDDEPIEILFDHRCAGWQIKVSRETRRRAREWKTRRPTEETQARGPALERCGKNDWVDIERLIEIDGNDYQPGDVDDAQEEFIEELENELGDLQGDLEAIEEQEEEVRLTRDIHELKADIEACKNHQW